MQGDLRVKSEKEPRRWRGGADRKFRVSPIYGPAAEDYERGEGGDMKRPHRAGEDLKRLRGSMQWTQEETGHFLGLSEKALQSYEQGWRRVPESVWKELLTLVAIQRGYPRGYRRCWEIIGCPVPSRASCFCAGKMAGLFCWMTATTNCHFFHPELKKSMLTCVRCPVTAQFLNAPAAARPRQPRARRPAAPRRRRT